MFVLTIIILYTIKCFFFYFLDKVHVYKSLVASYATSKTCHFFLNYCRWGWLLLLRAGLFTDCVPPCCSPISSSQALS